ncbi:MAG: hypothetical protein RL367_2832 [Pseudomonadota bacterium]|jgi:predicted transcriptional regulator
MKVAISIPDAVFHQAEALAKQLKLPRSRIYARALDAFVRSHTRDQTAEINAAVDQLGNTVEPFVAVNARRVLQQVEW